MLSVTRFFQGSHSSRGRGHYLGIQQLVFGLDTGSLGVVPYVNSGD